MRKQNLKKRLLTTELKQVQVEKITPKRTSAVISGALEAKIFEI